MNNGTGKNGPCSKTGGAMLTERLLRGLHAAESGLVYLIPLTSTMRHNCLGIAVHDFARLMH